MGAGPLSGIFDGTTHRLAGRLARCKETDSRSLMHEDRPWLRFYGNVPTNIAYPDVTLYEALASTADRVPSAVAWDFFGTRSTYAQLLTDVDRCAAALAAEGLCPGDRFLVSMPTSPQAVIAFYAANRLGALPALIHPLSTAPEITHFLDLTNARMALTLDAFYGPLAAATPKTPLARIIVARIPDYLPPLKRFAFWVAKGRKIPPVPDDPRVRAWAALLASVRSEAPHTAATTGDPAAILFSGGTTGLPKGIVLSNRNFIAQGLEAAAWCGLGEKDAILAILPIFHGFGLGVCVNAAFMAGGKSILVPQFSAEIVSKLLRTERPSVLVGVPTLFDALTKDPSLARADLSCLTACFCGADTLPRAVKERFEALVKQGGGRVQLLEGYGLTEAVTGIMAMPLTEYREGSIGIPFPDMLAKIVQPGTTEEMPVGEEGEICVAGPAVMLGYLDDPDATAQTLRAHADGRTWLHTGDLGRMDADGFFYFAVRLKRMIKSSGFNVYPAQVEAVLCAHPSVAAACVIGVPDPVQVERVVAYAVLRDPTQAGSILEQALIAHCQERLIKWSCPREVAFLPALPHTKVGKVDYRELVRHHEVKEQS
jgi:long-chain acyl-CoA synthetase